MGMGDNGSVADMALGYHVGSQEFSLKCHFRLRQAGDLCKNQVQAEGKASLDHPPTTSRKICCHEGTMQEAFLPLGFVTGSTMPVASPLTSGSVSGCTLHAAALGHSTFLSAAPWGSISPDWD